MMNNNIWPVIIDGRQFEEPHFNQNSNSYQINGINLVDMVMENPGIWNYLFENKDKLSLKLREYMDNISEEFIQTIPNKTLGKIKLPATEWQEQNNHQYVITEYIHCANYSNYLLPFHDADNQYACFFIDIDNTVRTGQLTLFWQEEQETDGTYEEHLFTCAENIEILYSPKSDDDEKDNKIAILSMSLEYMKDLANDRLDEIEQSSEDVTKILFIRLRSKIRNGKHGRILSVQGILSESQRDIMEDTISNVVNEDEEFKKKHYGISYKLTRSELFGRLKINAVFLLRIFDEYDKEIKLHASFKHCLLYCETSDGYSSSLKSLLNKTTKKYKKKKRKPKSLFGFNGIRFTFNGNKIKLSTNDFQSTIKIDKIDINKQKYPIKETLGRKSGW